MGDLISHFYFIGYKMKQNDQPEIRAAIDQRLEDAIAQANFRITLNNQIQNARLKSEKGMTFSINGGLFNISPELISFTNTLISLGQTDAVMLDVNKNPIEITDLQEFLESIVERYYESMNEFLTEFKSIRTKRTTKSLLGE